MKDTCERCLHWNDGYCEVIYNIQEDKSKMIDIEVEVLDDSGLSVHLRTGPNFGCVLYAKLFNRRVVCDN